MRLSVITETQSDLTTLLLAVCPETRFLTEKQAINADFTVCDAICLLLPGKSVDFRLRVKLENAADAGARIFAEAPESFRHLYCAPPTETTRSRLIYTGEGDVEGLSMGDLLDDHANFCNHPHFTTADIRPILVYKEHIIAHSRVEQTGEEIMSGSRLGMWLYGGSVMMTSFRIANFNCARFAPRAKWQAVIGHIISFLCGKAPDVSLPPPLIHGADADTEGSFDACRMAAARRGIDWLSRFLVDEGKGGIMEGLHHDIAPDGSQKILTSIRTDCTGEAAGAFRFYAELAPDAPDEENLRAVSENLENLVFGPMTVHGGFADGMLRWTNSAYSVCYQDDAARAILPVLLRCHLTKDDTHFAEACRALDFLVSSTPKDGNRPFRTDLWNFSLEEMSALARTEHGHPSAHYNAYYHAALLLAYLHGGDTRYLTTARTGLETLMSVYPNTAREQSETEEQCRLIFPLALLYEATGEAGHRAMLDRVTEDLELHRHPFGGYCEWDTGYTAACSRESRGECSILTENGDPVADLLYSCNWLPVGFAYAYYATGEEKYRLRWKNIVSFFLRTQLRSENQLLDGCWCRAFDMELAEVYACPHDAGWAPCSSETGWTVAEILMGMMLPDLMKKRWNSDT